MEVLDDKLETMIGKRIRIIHMIGEPSYEGREGVIEYVDDIGQLHGTWGGLAVIPEEDSLTVLEVTK